jgi:4-amino-4-deoxy-L-arabinose transferase-like glycosyltransferase
MLMEGQAVYTTTLNTDGGASTRQRDWLLLVLLLCVALALHICLLFRAEVPARDTIGFIRYALQFEENDWASVVHDNHQHPGYPLTIYAVSIPVRAFSTYPLADTMSFCSRLASSLAAVLLVIPMFYLGKILFHRAVGFGAAALFQILPVPAHIMSDGLSEPLYLLLASSALVFASLAVRDRKGYWFALAGAFCGLAYLTRPEGGLLAVATLVALVGLQWTAAHHRPWREVAGCAACLVGTVVVVGSPYVLATGGLSNKPSVQDLLHAKTPAKEALWSGPGGRHSEVGTGFPRPLWACLWAINFNASDSTLERTGKAVYALGAELVKSFHYVAWIPAVLGMWWFRHRALQVPGTWVLLASCGLLAIVLWRLALTESYMSDRHLLLIVMAGCYAAAAAVWELPGRLLCRYRRQAWPPPEGDAALSSRMATAVSLGLLAVLLAVSLPKTFERLHGNRAGYHAAGVWLAEHATPWDAIDDDHCWAHYYAGGVFLENHIPPKPIDVTPTLYVVVGRREREHLPTPNLQKKPQDEETILAKGGQVVFAWPHANQPFDASVVVYAVPPPGSTTARPQSQ